MNTLENYSEVARPRQRIAEEYEATRMMAETLEAL